MYRCWVTVVLIGNIEEAAIRVDSGDKGHMTSSGKGPDSISNREDSYCSNTRCGTQWQAISFGIADPVGGVTPVTRQIIAKQMPLLPSPPDTVSPSRKWARTQNKRITISRE